MFPFITLLPFLKTYWCWWFLCCWPGETVLAGHEISWWRTCYTTRHTPRQPTAVGQNIFLVIHTFREIDEICNYKFFLFLIVWDLYRICSRDVQVQLVGRRGVTWAYHFISPDQLSGRAQPVSRAVLGEVGGLQPLQGSGPGVGIQNWEYKSFQCVICFRIKVICNLQALDPCGVQITVCRRCSRGPGDGSISKPREDGGDNSWLQLTGHLTTNPQTFISVYKSVVIIAHITMEVHVQN